MIADADRQVKARLGSIEEETEIQKQRLAEAQAATARYFDSVRSLCNGQLQQLDEIIHDYVPAEEEAPAEAEPEFEPETAPEAEPAYEYDPNGVENVAAQLGLDNTQTFNL